MASTHPHLKDSALDPDGWHLIGDDRTYSLNELGKSNEIPAVQELIEELDIIEVSIP